MRRDTHTACPVPVETLNTGIMPDGPRIKRCAKLLSRRLRGPAHHDDAQYIRKLPEPWRVNIPYLSACLATPSVLI